MLQYLQNILNQHHLELSQTQLGECTLLSNKRLNLIKSIIEHLAKINQLNQNTFDAALSAVVFKIPSVELSTIEKENFDSHSKLTLNQKVVLFIPRGKTKKIYGYRNGNHVCKGYPDANLQKAIWAVKCLDKRYNPVKIAKRESKYNRFVGRDTFFYRTHKSAKIIYRWQHGRILSELLENNGHLNYLFEQRLGWAISLLKTLDKLHDALCVYGDIHLRNVVVNPETNEATFIDFGSTRRINTVCEPIGLSYEVGAMHIGILGDLFKSEKTNDSIYGMTINCLFDAMGDYGTESNDRCTIKQVLNYCQRIQSNLLNLDINTVLETADSTINRTTLTINDVLHGSVRPLNMMTKF